LEGGNPQESRYTRVTAITADWSAPIELIHVKFADNHATQLFSIGLEFSGSSLLRSL